MNAFEQREATTTILGRLKPQSAIALALSTAFLLFLSLDLWQAAVTNEPILTIGHALGFLRGFLAIGSGMLFVWIIMHRKERELLLLRDHFASQAHLSEVENHCLVQDFLAVINHRMRTPIRANATTAKLMAEGAFGAVTNNQIELLQHLVDNNESVERLCAMLVDIYNYKTGNKRLSIAPCLVDELVASCVRSLREKCSASDRIISTHLDNVVVDADAAELSVVLHHLIENAVKYARSQVIVCCGWQGDAAAIVVADDGNGIPPNDVADLFNHFYQRSSAGRYAAMTGVGLCLCAEIVKAHAGTIACKSKVNEGTRFVIRLPQSQLPTT